MTTQLIVGIVAFVCSLVCAIAGTVVVFEMVNKVNARLPEDHQFSQLGWHLSKYRRLLAEYARL